MDISQHLREPEVAAEVASGFSLSDIFEEEPVPLNVFIEDARYLSNPPLSPAAIACYVRIRATPPRLP